MLIGSVIVYLLVTIAIGLWAAQRVHNSKDYVLAGRSLPLYMNTATVFATWFGAESVLSVSVEFSKSGLGGIIADPFGSSMCLVLVAVFFARAFYRMDLLTIGDFYRKRYGKTMELGTSVIISISYLGWTAAQLTALGLVFSTLTDGAISLSTGILISGAVVLAYTIWGGMWSVAVTDLFQSVMIIVGLAIVAWIVGDMAGGPGKVIAAAAEGMAHLDKNINTPKGRELFDAIRKPYEETAPKYEQYYALLKTDKSKGEIDHQVFTNSEFKLDLALAEEKGTKVFRCVLTNISNRRQALSNIPFIVYVKGLQDFQIFNADGEPLAPPRKNRIA